MKESDRFWLAGLLEGEGSFMSGPPSCPNRSAIQLSMTDEDVVRRAAGLLAVGYIHKRVPSESNHKISFSFRCRGARAVSVMSDLRPIMGQRRQKQIDKAISAYSKRVAMGFGTHNGHSVLTEDQAAAIKDMYLSGAGPSVIAKTVGASVDNVKTVIYGKAWGWVAPTYSGMD